MFDDLTAYYHENVVAAYIDYRDIKSSGTAGRSRDIRSAMIAASALFHLREHLPTSNKLSRTTVEKQCPEYGLVADIVNAAKHKNISRETPHGSPMLNDATQIEELIILTEYKDEKGEYRFAEKTVIVKLSNGSTRDLYEVLTIVINYWENFLYSHNILATVRTFSDNSNNLPKTREECEQNRLNLEIVQGHRFRQSMLIQRYNYQTRRAESIDLTGAQIKCSAYKKPKYEIDLSLTNNTSGKEYRKTITLSEEETQELLKFKTGEERQVYVK